MDASEVVLMISDTTGPLAVVLDICCVVALITVIRRYRLVGPVESFAVGVSTPLFVWLGCQMPSLPN